MSGDCRFYPSLYGSELYTYNDLISCRQPDVNLLLSNDYRKEKLCENATFIMDKYSLYLKSLATELNYLHNDNLSLQFWKKSLGISFKRYISMLHMSLIEFSNFDVGRYKIHAILVRESYFIPEDFEDQREFLQNTDLGREQLFSIFISNFYPDVYNSAKKITINSKKTNVVHKFDKFKFKLKFKLKKLKAFVFGEHSLTVIGILDSFFSNNNRKIVTSNKHIAVLQLNDKEQKCGDSKKRKALGSSLQTHDLFDKYYALSLKVLLPKYFIENFLENKSLYTTELQKYPNLKYIICEAWISSTRDSFILAIAKEFKSVLHVYNEHNSLFHPFLGNNTELTSSMVDIYYTLGWGLDGDESGSTGSNIKSGASLFFDQPCHDREFDAKQILFMDVATFGYLEEYNTYYSESDIFAKSYFTFLKDFFCEIDGNLKACVTYREYPVGARKWLTYDNKDFLKKYFPSNLIFDDLKISGSKMMAKSALNIIPYTNTAYIQSLILNIPTIFFWNKSVAHLDNNYADFFDALIAVGICHTSPIEAARFLCSIESDIEGWWFSDATQLARKFFLDKNINSPEKAFYFYTSLVKK